MEKTKKINRLSLTLNVVSIAIVGYFCFMNLAGCNRPPGETNESNDLTDSPQTTLSPQQTLQPQEPNCCEPCQSNVQYDLIYGNTLSTMALDYQKTRDKQNLLCGPGSLYPCNDAGSVWFALEDLKKFICQIEHAAVCDCPPHRLGVRIYYARYPENVQAAFPDPNNPTTSLLPASYGLMHTVFMIPTHDKPGDPDTHYDFRLNPGHAPNVEDACYPPILPNDSVPALLPNGRNHGTLCPPLCGASGAVAFGH